MTVLVLTHKPQYQSLIAGQEHVLRKYRIIRELITKLEIAVEKIPTEDSVTDPLTKALAQDRHDFYMGTLGLKT